jgi:hypothetical protein
MVKLRNDMTHCNVFDFSKIHYQSLLGMTGLIVDFSRYSDMQPIGMTMNVFAWAVVAIEGVGHVEGEDFGYSDGHG